MFTDRFHLGLKRVRCYFVMDKRMEINILDYRLKVTSIKKEPSVIAKYTHALINILFLRNARLKTQYR